MAEAPLYRPSGWDEALTAAGEPRPGYEPVLEALSETQLGPYERRLAALLDERAVEFIATAGKEVFHLDLVPRIAEPGEWRKLAAGLRQRATALNAFIRDAYSERRIVAEGLIPGRVLETADHFERRLDGQPLAADPAPIIGFDLVRGADGRLAVLEDNTRTPSGFVYAVAAREALSEIELPLPRPQLADPAACFAALGRALTPPAGGIAILLSDGPTNSAWYEHREVARRLELPLMTPADVRSENGRLLARLDGDEREVALVYRRTDADRLFDERDRPTELGDLLLGPMCDGGLVVCNAFGAGVADDKLVHAYVEAMIRFYLGEEPIVPSVRSYDLSEELSRAEVLARLEEMVVKPRAGLGGQGVVVCAHAEPDDLAEIRREIEERPEDYIAQETIELSTHPTAVDERLEPRHVDLRAYTIAGELAPAPLTRFARDRGALVVNSSEGGGAKDTWVLN